MDDSSDSDKNEDKDGKKISEENKHSGQGPSKRKKPVKFLRFQLPLSPTASEDSFSSALSHEASESEESDFDDEDEHKHDHDATQPNCEPSQESILEKVVVPVSSNPRKPARKHYLIKSSDFIFPASSSQQLLEVSSDSMSHSDADFRLIKAIYLRKLEAVKQAIEMGAKVNGIAENQAPLMIATELGDDRLVAFLLTVPNINPDTTDYFGQTPLIIAIRNAFDNIVKLLLNHNADVNIADHMGKTPLHGVLFQKRPYMAKLLLAYGADVEKCDCFGERPIYTSAVKQPNLECLITLLKMGADVNYANLTGIPLLSRTIMDAPHLSIVEALVKFGASVNSQDLVSRKTPLHFAVLQNDIKILQFLISKGADPNLKNVYNFTPLDEANFYRNVEAAIFLEAHENLTKN